MKRILIIILSVSVLCPMSAQAQGRTGYFVESSTTRHNLNPAFSPVQGYVGIPLLSDLGITSYSNLGVADFLYDRNGTACTFLNSRVSADDFLSGIDSGNYLDAFVSADIVDVGFRTRNLFWTVNFGVRADVESSIPYDFFSFVKNGMADRISTKYAINGMNLSADVYAQASIGVAANIESVEGLSVGGRVKMLFGLGSAALTICRMNVGLSQDLYSVSTQVTGYVAGSTIKMTEGEDGRLDGIMFDSDDSSLAGTGFGVDLGIAYRISEGCALDGLGFSFSVVDLGYISYKSDRMEDLYVDDVTLTYSGAEFPSFKTADFSGCLEALREDFFTLMSLRQKEAISSRTDRLAVKLYAGVDYSFCQDKMKVGLLYYMRKGGYRTHHELTLGWNYSPARMFNVALSCSFLNSIQSFGWLLTFTPRHGLNIFLGSDYTAFRYTAHGVPLKTGFFNANFGISVPIQKKYVK